MDVPAFGSPKTGSSYSSFTDVSQTDNRSAVLRRRSGRTGQTRPSRSGTGVANFLNFATGARVALVQHGPAGCESELPKKRLRRLRVQITKKNANKYSD